MIPGLSFTRWWILGALVLGGALGLQARGGTSDPPIPPLPALSALVHDQVAQEIARDLPEPGAEVSLLLPEIPGDRGSALRARRTGEIERGRRFGSCVPTETRTAKELPGELLSRLPSLLGSPVDAARAGSPSTWRLSVRIVDRREDEAETSLRVAWHLEDRRGSGIPIAEGAESAEVRHSWLDHEYLRWRVLQTSPVARLSLWLLALLLPWLLLRRAARGILDRESNTGNLLLWSLLATPGILAGFVLTGLAAGGWGTALTIANLPLVLAASYAWLCFLERSRR